MISLDNYVRYPLSEVTVIKDRRECWMDLYWVITPEQEILIYRGISPQCNSVRAIAERMCPEGCHIESIPVVYLLNLNGLYKS